MENFKKINFDYYREIKGVEVQNYAQLYMGQTILVSAHVRVNNKLLFTCDCYAHPSYFADLLNIDHDVCTPNVVRENLRKIENQIKWEFEFPNK